LEQCDISTHFLAGLNDGLKAKPGQAAKQPLVHPAEAGKPGIGAAFKPPVGDGIAATAAADWAPTTVTAGPAKRVDTIKTLNNKGVRFMG
jgi:hypothetical protein